MVLPVDLFIRSKSKVINLRNAPDVKLSISYGEHGDDTASFQMCDWLDKLPELRSPIFLRDPIYGVFWSGYTWQPKLGGFFGGATQIQSRGWYHSIQDDGWDTEKKWAAGTPLVNLVNEAISKMAHITSGISFPGGLTTTQLPEDSSDFAIQSPEDVLEFVKNHFTYLSTPLVWLIRNNPATLFADQPSLEMKFVDTSPRYRVRLNKNDEFTPIFDSDTVFNGAMLTYGNGLFESELAPEIELYKVISDIRKKRINVNNDVTGIQQAQALVRYLIQRNNTLRPINTTLVLHCDTKVEAIPPIWTNIVSNYPKYLIRTHYGIRILNNMSKWGPYAISDYYIIDAKHDFETGATTLILGDPVFFEAFKLLLSYITNRSDIAIESGVINEPLRDADNIPVIGPTATGITPADTGQGIPIFYLDKAGLLQVQDDPAKPYLPHSGGLHPKIIPDYGVQGNYGRDVTLGIKGFIRLVPCKLLDWTLDFVPGPGSDILPEGTISVQLYGTWPFTPGTAILDTIQILTGSSNSGVFSSPLIFTQNSKVGIRVSVTGAGTNMIGAGFQLAVGGQKLYPDLGVTS